MVNQLGEKKWSTIAPALPRRIGKQCCERWNNHLNSGINKQAWTQDEELAMIQAHQIYGNKWAELRKFLPERRDNAIKKHWNSSTKMNLGSYLALGLLTQFKGLPLNSFENSGLPDGDKVEEMLEYSQGSTTIGCSQTEFDLPSFVVNSQEDKVIDDRNQRVGQSSSSSSCSKHYYTSHKEDTCSGSVVPYGTVFSAKSSKPNSHELPCTYVVDGSANAPSDDDIKTLCSRGELGGETGLSESTVKPQDQVLEAQCYDPFVSLQKIKFQKLNVKAQP
ncbi:hypothetical protein GIB67_002431 [Kingdonia uniflora]|uniref:Uncharacterized protein n=1 Tax=Kingdonia uniflora TaxID=39325 RepID=A0A7J7KYC0_9MAGN|nr:hypothetical protein GIB67_002431 [Kingdonia uniflora]